MIFDLGWDERQVCSFFEPMVAMIRIANGLTVGIFMVLELSWVFLLNYDWGEEIKKYCKKVTQHGGYGNGHAHREAR